MRKNRKFSHQVHTPVSPFQSSNSPAEDINPIPSGKSQGVKQGPPPTSSLRPPGVTGSCWDSAAMHFLFIFQTGSCFQVSSTDSPSRNFLPVPFNTKSVAIYPFTALATFAMAAFLLLLTQPSVDKLNNAAETPSEQ